MEGLSAQPALGSSRDSEAMKSVLTRVPPSSCAEMGRCSVPDLFMSPAHGPVRVQPGSSGCRQDGLSSTREQGQEEGSTAILRDIVGCRPELRRRSSPSVVLSLPSLFHTAARDAVISPPRTLCLRLLHPYVFATVGKDTVNIWTVWGSQARPGIGSFDSPKGVVVQGVENPC